MWYRLSGTKIKNKKESTSIVQRFFIVISSCSSISTIVILNRLLVFVHNVRTMH